MPRSPISTTRSSEKRFLSLSIWLASVDGDRAACGGAQQPEHDLQLARLAVAIVTELGERAGAAFEIGRGYVVEHQRAIPQVTARQRGLDALLLPEEPVERAVKCPLVNRAKSQHGTERTVRRRAIEQARRRQLGGRIDQARHHHGDAQRNLARRLPTALRQNVVEPELAQHAEPRRHVPVRQAAQQGQPVRLIAARQLIAK
jgi:hypothetical protein